MGLEDPRWREMRTADQASVIGMVADRDQINPVALSLDHDVGTRNGQFTDPALPEAAANHDRLGPLPRLGLQKSLRDMRELLGKVLHGTMNDGSSLEIIADQDFVELLLIDLL